MHSGRQSPIFILCRFYLVTGSYPYKADTVYLLLKAIDEDPVLIPDGLDEDLHDLLASIYLSYN